MATSKQIDYIASLAADKGYKSAREAAVAYGMEPTVSLSSVSNFDASGLIEWLKAPAASAESAPGALAAIIAEQDAAIAARTEAARAAIVSKVTDLDARAAEIFPEEWAAAEAMSGGDRREAKRLLRRRVEAI